MPVDMNDSDVGSVYRFLAKISGEIQDYGRTILKNIFRAFK